MQEQQGGAQERRRDARTGEGTKEAGKATGAWVI